MSLKLRLSFTRIITEWVTDGFVTSFFVWKEKTVAHQWTSVWSVVPMTRSSVPQSEITFHTDYHGVGHGWFCYERFYVRKKRNPWLIRGHLCEALSPWFSVVSLNLRLRFTRIITDCVTDDFDTSFLSEKRNTWLIRGHPCEELSPWFSVVCFKLRLSFTRIITDEPRIVLLRAFLCQEKEKSVTHLWTSVWSVASMILSSVLQVEIKFHTDYHGWATDVFVTSFFVWKEKSVNNPWTSVWRVVSMIHSLIICRDDTSMRGGK